MWYDADMDVAIVDDVREDAETLRRSIVACSSYVEGLCNIHSYASASSFLAFLPENSFDVVFLDIYMDGMDGMTLAKKLRSSQWKGVIVFSSASMEHALQGYGVDAAGYLLKPFALDDFRPVFRKAVLLAGKKKKIETITVISERLERHIPVADILTIEAGDHCVVLNMKKESVMSRILFSEIEEKVKPFPVFLKVSRGCIVNMDNVESTDKQSFYLSGGQKVLMNYKDSLALRQTYHDYRWTKMREEE